MISYPHLDAYGNWHIKTFQTIKSRTLNDTENIGFQDNNSI